MGDETRLEWICNKLVAEHRAHTILLYGSRAEGSAGKDSDYDLAAYGPIDTPFRIARLVKGEYVDVWAYPEAELQRDPNVGHLRLRGSQIVQQRGSEAEAFLGRIEDYFLRGPEPLSAGETEARKVWAYKTLARAARGDPEGNYRRFELIQVLLENYFQVRGQWFLGPKKSLRWLEQFDPPAFRSFCMALQPNASNEAIASLVHLMVGVEDT